MLDSKLAQLLSLPELEFQGCRKTGNQLLFAGQQMGVKETEDGIWLLSFMDYDLGYFDLESKKLDPIEDPFGSGLLPMSPE